MLSTCTYTAFLTALGRGQVEVLSIQPGERITGQWRAPALRAGAPYGFAVVYPQLDASGVLARAEKAGVSVSFDAPPDKERNKTLLAILIQVVLFGGKLASTFRAFLPLLQRIAVETLRQHVAAQVRDAEVNSPAHLGHQRQHAA